ncbi:MAG TPA: hypothetical protein DDX37_07260 [Candidatus Omnitrophica bacterium]|nr:MAG: hypothetical protein A2447_03005 [Omnitrophica WOR_2 bacterium RIFOXYC2_FULL_38_12]HBG61609.1 hypothetical protein [Candidatus Omnitrophota bacterium]
MQIPIEISKAILAIQGLMVDVATRMKGPENSEETRYQELYNLIENYCQKERTDHKNGFRSLKEWRGYAMANISKYTERREYVKSLYQWESKISGNQKAEIDNNPAGCINGNIGGNTEEIIDTVQKSSMPHSLKNTGIKILVGVVIGVIVLCFQYGVFEKIFQSKPTKQFAETMNSPLAKITQVVGNPKIEIHGDYVGGDKIEGRSVEQTVKVSEPAQRSTSDKVEITLLYLFNHDFGDRLLRSREDEVLKSIKDGSETKIKSQIFYDFEAQTKFVGFYIPSDPATFEICINLVDHYKDVFQQDAGIVVETEGPHLQPVQKSELKFSGRVFVYHEYPLLAEQKRKIFDLYNDHGLSIQFRGSDYLWKMKEKDKTKG